MNHQETLDRLDRLEAVVANVARVAVVDAVYPAEGKASVIYHDLDGMKSKPLPVLQPATHKTRFYALPDPGDQVLVVNLPIGLEGGFIVGSLYSGGDKPPADSGDRYRIQISDGSAVEYDRAAHRLTVAIQGNFDMVATGAGVIRSSDTLELFGSPVTINPPPATFGVALSTLAQLPAFGHYAVPDTEPVVQAAVQALAKVGTAAAGISLPTAHVMALANICAGMSGSDPAAAMSDLLKVLADPGIDDLLAPLCPAGGLPRVSELLPFDPQTALQAVGQALEAAADPLGTLQTLIGDAANDALEWVQEQPAYREAVAVVESVEILSGGIRSHAGRILTVASNTVSQFQAYGLNQAQAATLAQAVLDYCGLEDATATTAAAELLGRLSNAAAQNQAFQDALATIGLTLSQLETLIATDPQAALQDVLGMIKDAADPTQILTDMFGSVGPDLRPLVDQAQGYVNLAGQTLQAVDHLADLCGGD